MLKDITVVIGPTAIGKSDYAIDLALKTGAQIISADAFQVYRGMDIGTAKVPVSERRGVPHHLIDIIDPDQPYSVADFIRASGQIIEALRKQNIPIIICGGTGLYLRSFLYGYEFRPPDDKSPFLREKLAAELQEKGPDWMYQQLRELDPQAALNIHPANHRRVIRALEIAKNTGQSLSETRKNFGKIREDCQIIGLTAERSTIYERINLRVDRMFQSGLLDEVKHLLTLYPSTLQSFQAIGYKECVEPIRSLDEVIDLVKLRTRHFAKRQLTWYRQFDHVQWTEIQ